MNDDTNNITSFYNQVGMAQARLKVFENAANTPSLKEWAENWIKIITKTRDGYAAALKVRILNLPEAEQDSLKLSGVTIVPAGGDTALGFAVVALDYEQIRRAVLGN